MIKLDATDWKILGLLQGDGRMTNAELATRIHRSESACHRRVRRLETEGVIEAYIAVVNQAFMKNIALPLGVMGATGLGLASYYFLLSRKASVDALSI